MMDEIIASVRAQTGDRFEVLGEIAGDPRGGVVCLARDSAQDCLVALVLGKRGAGQGGTGDYSVEVHTELGVAFITLEAVCDVCGTPATGQSPTCSTCGMRMDSVDTVSVTDKPADEALSALREAAAGAYEVFGEMPRADGLGALYFGREKATGNVVPLSVRREVDGSGQDVLAVGATQLIWVTAPATVEPEGTPSSTSQGQATPEDPSPAAPLTPAEPVASAPETAPVPPVALGPIFGKLPPEEQPPLDPDANSEVEVGHRETFDEIIRAQVAAQAAAPDTPAEPAVDASEPAAHAEPETTATGEMTEAAAAPATPAVPVAPAPEVATAAAAPPVVVAPAAQAAPAAPAPPPAPSVAAEAGPDSTPPTPPPSATKPSWRRRGSMLPIVVAVLAAVVVGVFTVSSSGDIALVRTASAPTIAPETAPAAVASEAEAPAPTESPSSTPPAEPVAVLGATLRIDGGLPEFAVVSIDGLVYAGRTVSLAPGSHRVFVRADGYLPVDTVIVLEPGRVFALTPAMRRISGADAATYVSGAVSLSVPLPTPAGDGESIDIPTTPLPAIPEPLGTPRNEPATVVERTPPPTPVAPAPAPPPAPAPLSPPPPPTVAHELLNIGLNNFAMALQSREIERVAGAYPGMTQSERSTWMEFFGSVNTLRVALANVQATPITGEIVQIPFTLIMDFSDRGGTSRQLSQNYRATFIQRADGWRIEAIRPN